MRSARSSVVRETRDTSETTIMPRMNRAEMAMPSGFSMTFSTSAYSRTSVSTPNPIAAPRWRRRIAEMLTATDPDTIIARMPVAYAPACALTSAPNAIVSTMLIAV